MKYLRYMVASSFYLTFIGCLLLGSVSLSTGGTEFFDGVLYFILAFIALAAGVKITNKQND